VLTRRQAEDSTDRLGICEAAGHVDRGPEGQRDHRSDAGPSPATTLAFIGTATPFSVSGVPISQNAAILQAGIAYSPLPNLSVGLIYAGQLAPNVQENSLNGTIDFKF